jgi:hypothetical protein
MRACLRARSLVTACSAAAFAATALLAATVPAVAGAGPHRSAGPGGGAATVAASQQDPDAPADDGTGASADDQVDEGLGEPVPADDIIPLPNSGREPTDAGDRGGALQVAVLVVMVAAVGGATAVVVRESRRNRDRARARQP